MRRWIRRDRSSSWCERGAAATEYALIVAGVAVVVLFGVQVFGSLLDARWTSLLTSISG